MRTRLRGCRQHRHRPTDKSSGAPLTMVHRSCPCFAPICRDLTAHCVLSPRPPLPAPPWPEWIPAPLPLPPPAPAFDVEAPPSPAARGAELDRLVDAAAPFVGGVGAAEACTRMTDWALSTGPAILRVPPTVLSIKWQAASRSAVLQPRRQRELAPHRCGSSGKQLAALTSHRRAPTTASLEAAARPASREVPSPSEVQHRRGLLVPSSGTAQVRSRRRLTVQARLEQYRSRRWSRAVWGKGPHSTAAKHSTARRESHALKHKREIEQQSVWSRNLSAKRHGAEDLPMVPHSCHAPATSHAGEHLDVPGAPTLPVLSSGSSKAACKPQPTHLLR